MDELMKIQQELRAPKGQFNRFGNYSYRSTEDILEALKPLLAKYGCVVTLRDDIVLIGDRYYVKSEVTIMNKDGKTVSASAFAREAETKKGMDESQITGTASSYARKYALNGLFAIDDNKDADYLAAIAGAEDNTQLMDIFRQAEKDNGGVVSDKVRKALTERKNEIKTQKP